MSRQNFMASTSEMCFIHRLLKIRTETSYARGLKLESWAKMPSRKTSDITLKSILDHLRMAISIMLLSTPSEVILMVKNYILKSNY